MRTIQTIIRNRHPLKQSQRLILLIAVALVGINRDEQSTCGSNWSPRLLFSTLKVPVSIGTVAVWRTTAG